MRCPTCPVEPTSPCLGLAARPDPATPGRLCDLAATDRRYADELRRRAGLPAPPNPCRCPEPPRNA